ncbi:fatty acyl-CoA synthetase [Gordonia sp. AC31]|uniref:fatty acyl-CoA synthetase n=1 Tax=Gordonia sp. AC31 TaxID=2962571 RepID=UPI002880BE7E|nr:fatty acyl-CoA synthetase [Gordonia sp. AC31]MDT0222932.1 fatty acyl-CoA synthetase [Gordonia sp. AC31]
MTAIDGGHARATITAHSLGDIPRRSAARWPHRTAIVHRDTTLTFAQLDDRVDAAASYLWSAGVRTGDRMMILAHNCWQFPVLVFAAARIGAIAVPVNFSLTAGELAYLIDDSTPALIVAEDALTAVADEAVIRATHRPSALSAIGLTGAATSTVWSELAVDLDHPHPPAPEVSVSDDLPIRIMYTSGTESRPKGVVHSSRTLMWQYMSCISSGGMEAGDVEVHALPLYHCAQLDNFLVTDIVLGAQSIILDRPDPTAILDAVQRHRATNLFCPPTVWVALVSLLRREPRDVSSLRKGYYGASALPTEILRELRTLLPRLRLWNFYGQTEMGSLATVLPPEQQDARPGSAGVAALNVTTRIVDDANRPVDPGVVGEIVHRSPQVTLGYHNRPEATAEAFAGGWFHSGDLGYFDDDGYLWVVDRKKDMIKTGGENVSSREVEEALFEIAGVREAAVYGVPHPKWIEAVAATVVPDVGAELDADSVIAACRDVLAPYKVPKYVLVSDELPKNPSGKILKRTLRQEFDAAVEA